MPSVKHARQDSSQGSAPFRERERGRERDHRRETGPYLSTCFLPLWHEMVTSLPLRESRGCGHSPSLGGMRRAAYPFLCLPLLFVFVMLFLRPFFGEEWRWPSSSSYVEGGQGPAKEEEEQEEEEWSGHPLSPLSISLSHSHSLAPSGQEVATSSLKWSGTPPAILEEEEWRDHPGLSAPSPSEEERSL